MPKRKRANLSDQNIEILRKQVSDLKRGLSTHHKWQHAVLNGFLISTARPNSQPYADTYMKVKKLLTAEDIERVQRTGKAFVSDVLDPEDEKDPNWYIDAERAIKRHWQQFRASPRGT